MHHLEIVGAISFVSTNNYASPKKSQSAFLAGQFQHNGLHRGLYNALRGIGERDEQCLNIAHRMSLPPLHTNCQRSYFSSLRFGQCKQSDSS